MALAEVRYTLLADGASDDVLMRHLKWLLDQHTPLATQPLWADLSRLPRRPKGLKERIHSALDLYPCDLLFVHRDAEKQDPHLRSQEIHEAVPPGTAPVVCVVPVRMQEAWLLFDEQAIRRAAGNPKGKVMLKLPPLASIERIADPKDMLYSLLKAASELKGRRLEAFRHHRAARLVGEYIADFSPLRRLSAFAALERDIIAALQQLGAS